MTAQPRWGADGLAPIVVQDDADGRVLMVGYTDAEALAATALTGELHFHSRSRDRLWRKGETSGNVLRLVRLSLDCDEDAILATVRPTGPTCHRGTRSCFDAGFDATDQSDATVRTDAGGERRSPGRLERGDLAGFAWLELLWQTILDRRDRRPAGSYTVSLLDGGVDAVGRKVIEEATEVLIAAKDDAAAEGAGRDRGATSVALAGEVADLLYHALVLLSERGQSPSSALDALRERHLP